MCLAPEVDNLMWGGGAHQRASEKASGKGFAEEIGRAHV